MPHNEHLVTEWNTQLSAGQKKLAHAMRTRIFRCLPAFYSKLDETDDAVFLEPFLFAYFSGLLPDSLNLEQLLAGSISNPGNSESIRVFSDWNGTIYLPSLGYLKTGLVQEEFTLLWDNDLRCYELKLGGLPAVFDFELPSYVRESGIELASENYVLSEPLFEEEARRTNLSFENIEKPVFPSQEAITEIWLPQLGCAMGLLNRICPDHLDAIRSVIRKIVFFESKDLPSFAAIRLCGCAFLNCRGAESDVSFIAELSACAAQLQFYLLTLERDRYFRLNPDEACMVEYAACRNSNFTIYQGLEELFISNKLAEALEACYRSKYFSGTQLQELAGRLAHNLNNCQTDFDTLHKEDVLTDLGIKFYREMIIQRAEIYAGLEASLAGFRVQNQPQVFSWKLFKKVNLVTAHSEFA